VFDRQKFRELIVYLARKSEGDVGFGATKLNKLLFFSDFAAYRRWGRSITGACYQKLAFGPAPRELVPLRAELEADGSILEVQRSSYGRDQRAIVARREPTLAGFSGEEIALVDEMIDRFRHMDAASISALSHEFVGWAYARLNEDIPYETALLNEEKPTPSDVERGIRLRKNGWRDLENVT